MRGVQHLISKQMQAYARAFWPSKLHVHVCNPCLCTHMFMCVRAHVHTYACTGKHLCACMHTHVHAYARAYACVHTRILFI